MLSVGYLLSSRATGKRRHAEFMRDAMLTGQVVLRPSQVSGSRRDSQVGLTKEKGAHAVPLLSAAHCVSLLSWMRLCTPVMEHPQRALICSAEGEGASVQRRRRRGRRRKEEESP